MGGAESSRKKHKGTRSKGGNVSRRQRTASNSDMGKVKKGPQRMRSLLALQKKGEKGDIGKRNFGSGYKKDGEKP